MLLLLSLAFNIVSSVLAVESLCNVAVAIAGDVDVDDEVVVSNVPILDKGSETAAETRELVEFIREAAFNTVGDSVLTSVVVVAELNFVMTAINFDSYFMFFSYCWSSQAICYVQCSWHIMFVTLVEKCIQFLFGKLKEEYMYYQQEGSKDANSVSVKQHPRRHVSYPVADQTNKD
uniref:Uncharacterized protein n=1 Tax=Glossina palpalis gambiensis TaxID=67801 RepID=A0A1B0BHE9_9MUSC